MAFGLFLGGCATLLACGDDHAFLVTTRSTAIKATFGLDPVDTAGGPGAQPSPANPSVTPELMSAVTVPFAVLGSAYGGTAASTFAPACAPADDNFRQYASHLAGDERYVLP